MWNAFGVHKVPASHGVPALLPPRNRNIVPEMSVIASADQVEVFCNVLQDADWHNVDQFRTKMLSQEAQRKRRILERDDNDRHRTKLAEHDRIIKLKRIIEEMPIVQQITSAELRDQAVALSTALNGSHGGSSASRLSEAEQGAGTAEASHPNFLQQAQRLQPKASSETSSAPSNEKRWSAVAQ